MLNACCKMSKKKMCKQHYVTKLITTLINFYSYLFIENGKLSLTCIFLDTFCHMHRHKTHQMHHQHNHLKEIRYHLKCVNPNLHSDVRLKF